MRIPKIGYSLLISLLLIVAFHVVSGSLPQPENKKRRIEILWADSITHDNRIIANADRFVGHVRFSQNNVLLNCDSAYFYTDSNKVDAYGHVHIIQGDSLNLYGDRIKYEGNTKIARLHGNVKLLNKSITLTTDELIFDLKTNVGNYHTWGKIVDTANVLVSKIGRYYSNEDLFFFKDSVKVTNKDFVLTADTLKYNSKIERVFLVGPTHIVGTSKKGTLYSEKGWYDTRTNIAELYKASRIMGKEQSLQGDTIFYSRNAGTGRARSRVLLSDTTNHIAITGKTGVYNEKTKIAFVTDSAIFMQFSKKDTLFLHADTLKSIPDHSKKPEIKKAANQELVAKKSGAGKKEPAKSLAKTDSLSVKTSLKPDSLTVKKDSISLAVAGVDSTATKPAVADTIGVAKSPESLPEKTLKNSPDSLAIAADSTKKTIKPALTGLTGPLLKDSLNRTVDTTKTGDKEEKKLFMAYHRVRFFKKDLQGLCDSLSYQMRDSMMRLFKDPVLWSDVHQMTAEKIEYHPHVPDPSIARLDNNSFIISKEDSIKFNQISGKTMVGYISNNALKNIEVNGNAITLYYVKNKDHYSGMNKLESSKISVTLVKGKIDDISFFPSPEGKTIPLSELKPDDTSLKGFEWREDEKPKDRYDLFPIDGKRKKIAGPDKKPATKKQPKSSL